MNRWIVIVIGLLAGNALAVVILIVSAGRADGDRVLPDYYARAAGYDVEIAAAKESARSGWKVETAIAGGAIVVRIADASGVPITGATVEIDAYPRARASERTTRSLAESAPGVYRAVIGARAGWWDVAIRARHRAASHVGHLAIEARP